jgi:hypothetical protein
MGLGEKRLLTLLALTGTFCHAQLPGIGSEQRQCWEDPGKLTPWEREVPLSELLMERSGAACLRIHSPAAWEAKRDRIKRSWRLLIGEPPLKAPPLDVRIVSEEKRASYIIRKIVFHAEPDDVVTAWLLVPTPLNARAPAVMACMPTSPYGKDTIAGLRESSDWWYGLELAERGYVVLAPDVLTTGERVSPGLDPLDTTAFYKKHPNWSMLGKMLWDYQRGLDYLTSLDFVDKSRIGAIGWSLGAHNACFLAAYDSRISAVVTDGGVIHFSGNPNPFGWCREFPTKQDGRVGKWRYMPQLKPYLLAGETPTDFHELQALIAPRPYLDMNSVQDTWKSGLSASKKLRRLYAFLGAPGQFDYYVFDGGHSFPEPMRAKAYAWLDQFLRK